MASGILGRRELWWRPGNIGEKMMSEQPAKKPQRRIQVKIEVPADLQAYYANFALISHSPSEIILDFAQVLPQQPKARVQARVVMTPLNAKLLHQALGENITRYEAQFGKIQMPKQGPSLAQQFFGTAPPKPEGEE
jgi:hypothetical protein